MEDVVGTQFSGYIRAGGVPGRVDPRGSSYARRSRKNWMLSEKAGFGGDGEKVPCTHCGAMLNYDTVEADRKVPGGTYARHNVQPSCKGCNNARNRKT